MVALPILHAEHLGADVRFVGRISIGQRTADHVTDQQVLVERMLGVAAGHFDHVIDVNVILSVEKLKQKAEVTVHLPGKDIFVEAIDEDLYAAIDGLGDKLDRQIQKHKQKLQDHHRGEKMNHAEAE